MNIRLAKCVYLLFSFWKGHTAVIAHIISKLSDSWDTYVVILRSETRFLHPSALFNSHWLWYRQGGEKTIVSTKLKTNRMLPRHHQWTTIDLLTFLLTIKLHTRLLSSQLIWSWLTNRAFSEIIDRLASCSHRTISTDQPQDRQLICICKPASISITLYYKSKTKFIVHPTYKPNPPLSAACNNNDNEYLHFTRF